MDVDGDVDVIVVGAGLSGLVAAGELGRAGRRVLLVDKGRSVGGRLATRRIGGATLDHGAQFFTTRSPEFTDAVASWHDAGVVSVWTNGFSSDDGYPRYRAEGGMNQLAKHLRDELPSTVEVVTSQRADAVIPVGDHLTVTYNGASREPDDAAAVVLTAPVPQSLDLLTAGGVGLPEAIARELQALTYHRVIALLATLDRPAPFGPVGARQEPDDPVVTFAADNHTKGISSEPAATFHVAHARSADLWDHDDDAVLRSLDADIRSLLGDATIQTIQVKRWRYAGPVTPHPDRSMTIGPEATPIVLCGDAFGGPKVEGAFLSGRDAAARLLAPTE